jgi:hypothetical protein
MPRVRLTSLVGQYEAQLLAPSTSGGAWTVVLRRDPHEHDLLLAAIGAAERTLRRHRDLCEATIRLGRRSYKVRNADAAPRRDAA